MVVVDPEFVELFHGVVRAHLSADLRIGGELSEDADIEIRIEYDSALERYVAASVTVTRNSPGVEVTGRLLREARIQDAISSVALRHMIEVDHASDGESFVSGEDALGMVKPMRGRPRFDASLDAGIVYNLAKLSNRAPLATVAELLEVSQSTATRLIAELRASDG